MLSIIASLASILAIPLMFWLYIRGQESKVQRLRKQTSRSLLFQIGEGRTLGSFEIQAVISSSARDFGLQARTVGIDEVVEDLVADTITNPLLESNRKEAIIDNLQSIHSEGEIYRVISRYDLSLSDFLLILEQMPQVPAEELAPLRELQNRGIDLKGVRLVGRRRRSPFEYFSGLFLLVAIVTGALVALASEVVRAQTPIEDPYRLYLTNLLLGAAVALASLAISQVRNAIRRRGLSSADRLVESLRR